MIRKQTLFSMKHNGHTQQPTKRSVLIQDPVQFRETWNETLPYSEEYKRNLQTDLKASTTSARIGKKRKEATASETRAYQKQFLEAMLLELRILAW